MKLHELQASAGARKAVTRKGRGAGSGNGKTAGFGQQGPEGPQRRQEGWLRRRPDASAASSAEASVSTTFSQPSMLPSRCLTSKKFEAGATVDTEALLKAGIISKTLDGVKVLGNGELTKALNVKVAAYTASAKEKIEKAGGKAEVM